MSAKQAKRPNDLARIHILQKQLGLSPEDASALKLAITGKASSADMSYEQRSRYAAHLQALAVKTGVAQPRPLGVGTSQFTRRRIPAKRSDSDAQDERWAKARALWAELAKAGKVQQDSDAALLAYVKRQTRMEAWRFLNGYQINMVIESLKQWQLRTSTKATQNASAKQ